MDNVLRREVAASKLNESAWGAFVTRADVAARAAKHASCVKLLTDAVVTSDRVADAESTWAGVRVPEEELFPVLSGTVLDSCNDIEMLGS